jgi:hypothetical protein
MIKTTFLLAAVTFTLSVSLSSIQSVQASNGVKGDWVAAFSIANHTADGTMSFDVNGTTLTGSVFTEHTGKGTLTDGTFDNNKLNCTLTFEKHESIALRGEFKDDKLSGTFDTEGMTGTWTAVRKK